MLIRSSFAVFVISTCTARPVLGLPQPLADKTSIEERQLLLNLFQGLQQAAQNVQDPYPGVLAALGDVKPGASPTSIPQVQTILSSAHATATARGYFEQAATLIASGLSSNDLEGIVAGATTENNATNNNPPLPKSKSVYPKKEPGDAPYSLTARQLREQIYIPDDFTYGKKPPVILIPGTGERGGNTYAGNFRKLLRGNPKADPVLLNYPGYGLADAQQNAEAVAYAMNYIAALTGKNVTVIAWSQGNLNVQWSFKYWPSTRKVVSNSIGFSPDYHGTIAANLLDPIEPSTPLPPSLIQQKYNSNFVKTLRANGGDSAYVPTTTIYSGFFDEIVEPQQGTGASGYLLDARNVGVTNVDIPRTCPLGTPAGDFADHESVLANSLTYALVNDALSHAGPAKVKRIDLDDACSRFAAPGLTLADVLNTESTIPFAGYQIIVYNPKVLVEPPIKSYART